MPIRNNVTRLLDSRGIAYQAFELPPEKHSAEETAVLLGIPPDHVFKTLVVLRETKGKKPLLVMVPAGRELGLKELAASLGEKKLRMASQREAEALTGLQVGGISALALMSRPFDICLDQSALAHEHVHISGGQRGLNVRLSVADLRELSRARLVATGPAPAHSPADVG